MSTVTQQHPTHITPEQWFVIRLALGLLISVLCLWTFGHLAEDVSTHDTIVNVDQAVADGLHTLATPSSTEAFVVISLLGSQVLFLLSFSLGVFYAVRRLWERLGVWIVALVGGEALNYLLKQWYARARPVFQHPLVIEANYSFPSGHAMMSLIGYGMLAYFALLALRLPGARALVVAGAAFLIFMIGLARIYLGVHFFSDVIGGYIAAGIWLSACITGAEALRYRRHETID